MEYPNNSVIQGSSPEGGARAHLCPSLFYFNFFSLSLSLPDRKSVV